LHDSLCNLPTSYNLNKIDSLSLRLSSTTVTSGKNLARLISNKLIDSSGGERDSGYPPRTPWNNQDNSENPFSKDNNSKENKESQDKMPKRVERFNPPGGPPDDGSNSDDEPKPSQSPKIPSKYDKQPLSNLNLAEPAAKSYHFDLKLKPEMVPQWDGNADTLARWLNKINRLADGSTNVHQELGKIIP